MAWRRKDNPTEHGGYTFEGPLFLTKGAAEALDSNVVRTIVRLVRAWVELNGTVDYFQAFVEADRGLQVWCIDHLHAEDRLGIPPGELARHDFWTTLLPEEY